MAKAEVQIIHIEAEEDVTSIRDRLDWVEARRVILVVPRGQRELTNPVHIRLVARKARDLALELILVSKDPLLRQLAREAGLPAYSSIGRARRIGKVPGPSQTEPVPEAGRPKAPRAVLRPASSVAHTPWWVLALILVPFILMVIVGSALFVPLARVKLSPVRETLNEIVTVTADPGIQKVNYEKAIVPARRVRLEITGKGSIPTTAKKDVPDAKATGTVVFINKTNQEVVVPMGTVVGTSTGVNIRFTTVETATLPPAYQSRAEVGIVAVDPGPMGNVGAYLINRVEGALALQVQVLNPNPTSGGSMRQVNVVTKADKDRLKSMVLQKLHQQAYQSFLEKLPDDVILLPQSITIVPLGESYNHFVDEVADELSLELKAVALGITVEEGELRHLVAHLVRGKIPQGYVLAEERLGFEIIEAVEDEEGRYVVELRAMGPLLARIDPGAVRGSIRGLPLDKAMEKLRALPLREEPQVEISPDWFGRIPWFPFRIMVEVEAGD